MKQQKNIIDSLYRSSYGRLLMKLFMETRLFYLGAAFLKMPASRLMIPGYIRKHKINMGPYKGQRYRTFSDFFSRKKPISSFVFNSDVLISPCDGHLSVYDISDGLIIPMKGSHYRLMDLVTNSKIASNYHGGLCLVFRLEAKDYHHFCCFDDARLVETHFIQGELHSVQPIACEQYPVFRLNRRWWSLIETRHFADAIQIEVGAMMVGGVSFEKEKGIMEKGEEMGHFELAGSTVILILNSSVREQLQLFTPFNRTLGGEMEVTVSMGEGIGVLRDEK